MSKQQLERVLTRVHRVLVEGLENPVCRDGGRPDYIIVSNGGPQLLVLSTGAKTEWAPPELTCWSAAADDLYEFLEDTFTADRGR